MTEPLQAGRRWVAFCAVLLVSLGVWNPLPASAGTYRVLECYPAAGASGAPDARFVNAPSGAFFAGNGCSSPGGYVEVGNNATYGGTGAAYPGEQAYWYYPAPAGTVFTGGSFNYYVWSSSPSWGFVGAIDPAGNLFDPKDHTSGPFALSRPASSIVADMSCGAPGGQICFGAADSIARIYELDLYLLDSVDPTLSVGGSVTEGAYQRGVETLALGATDQGGGPREARVWVNGVQLQNPQNPGCQLHPSGSYATRFQPCPATTFNVALNTQAAPFRDGANSIEACVYDVATNGDQPRSKCASLTVSVDNSCPDSQGATSQATALVAGFANNQGEVRPSKNVLSSEGATIKGSLTGPAGAVGGATVCLYEQIDAPAEIRQLVQVTKTRSDGTFTAYAPSGPSRVFDLVYRYNNAAVAKDQLYLDSTAVPTLQLGPKREVANGRAARFTGRIPGPHADGRAVTLQARAGKKWRTFKQLTTDNQGRFRGKYRFTQTSGRAKYQFRVAVKKQSGYPYSPGTSAPRKIIVHG